MVDRTCAACGAVLVGKLCAACAAPTVTRPICGMKSGYMAHRRSREIPCDQCKAAIAAYYRKRYAEDTPYRARVQKMNRERPRSSTYKPSTKPRFCACGASVSPQFRGRTICPACMKQNQQAREHRKRVKRRGARIGDKFTLAEIAERDGCRCHLCGKKVNMSLSGMHPQGPTIDHLLPISAGGLDERKNVALAHRRCNILRNNHGPAQLRLVG